MARCVSPARGHPVPRPRCGAPSLRGPAPTVPSLPFRSEAAAWTHLRLSGSGYSRLGASDVWTGQVRGRQQPPPVRGPPLGQGAFWPRAAPCLRPRGIVGEEAVARRREAGWAVSGRRACLPLPLPRGRPPAQLRGAPANSCCEPTAAPAGAPARTCPGEVRPCLLYRASGLAKTASPAGGRVWSRPQARWSHDLILGLRGLGK